MKMSPERGRNFACVVYPDSAPANWREHLQDKKVPCFISPLHDQDINNGDGKPKKPHYHVMVMFDGCKTKLQWDVFRDSFGGVGSEYIQSKKGYARYLCHLDNPEKHKYNPEEVVSYNGAIYDECIEGSYSKDQCLREILDYIDRHNIYAFSQLLRYARYNQFEWFNYLQDRSFVVREYLRGLSIEREMERQIENRQVYSKDN